MDGAFIVQGDNGFSAEVVWEAKNGTVIITALRAKSAYYGGYWFPDGTVKVNGETVFSMSAGPVSHVFHTVGPDFVDIEVFGDNQRLPVTSGKIGGGKATIDVIMYLHSDSESIRPKIRGSVEIIVDSVLPLVYDGAAFQQKQAVAGTGTEFRKYRPIIHDGTAWKQ
jgi:hypothetical protein